MNITKTLYDKINPKFSDNQTLSLTDSNEAEAAGSYIDLNKGCSGIGQIVVGDYDAYAYFGFKIDGTVELQMNSANVFTSLQTGTNHVIIKDNGTDVRIVNELGSTKVFSVKILYTV